MWFGFAWFIAYNHCMWFNAKSFLYIYIKYMISKTILFAQSAGAVEYTPWISAEG